MALALLPTATPQAESTPGELLITDATPDDVTIVYTGIGRTLPITEGLDLLKLRVFGEETDGFTIELTAKNLKGTQLPAGPAYSATAYYVEFQLEGTQVSYYIQTWLPVMDPLGTPPKGIQRIGANFCLTIPGVRCVQQRVISEVDWDESLLRFWIPKASLLGRDPVGGRSPIDTISVARGARLSGFFAQSFNQVFLSEDRIPNSGRQGPFILQQPAVNERIEARVTGGNVTNSIGRWYQATILDVPRLLVAPGEASLVPIVIQNHNGGKRIVKLTAEILDATDKEAWGLRVLSNLSIPGGQQRVVNLLINASGKLEHRSEALVRIRASAPGYPDEVGAARVRLIAGVTPDAKHQELRFHARNPASTCLAGCGSPSVWMNTLENDPRANSNDAAPYTANEGGATETYLHNHVRLDTPLGTALVFDVSKKIQVKLGMRSTLPAPGTVRAVLRAEEIVLASASASYTGGSMTLDLPLAPYIERIDPGTDLEFEFGVAFTGQGHPRELHQWIPKETRVTLPLIVDPRPRAVVDVPLGPALVTLALNGTDEQMGNPRESRAFRFSLLNEGVEEDVVRLGLNETTENWTAKLLPADRFRLRSGDSVVVTLLARVPRKAQEGERGVFVLNATSGNDPNARAQVIVSLVATEGVELPDDSENYTDDPDALDYVDRDPAKRSPGPGVLLAAMGLLAVTLLRRRRVD